MTLDCNKKHTPLQKKTDKGAISFDSFLRDKFPELTKSERKVCALVRIGLSIKEIALLRGTTVGAIQSMRYRIRKKMDIPKGKELQQILENMEN